MPTLKAKTDKQSKKTDPNKKPVKKKTDENEQPKRPLLKRLLFGEEKPHYKFK